MKLDVARTMALATTALALGGGFLCLCLCPAPSASAPSKWDLAKRWGDDFDDVSQADVDATMGGTAWRAVVLSRFETRFAEDAGTKAKIKGAVRLHVRNGRARPAQVEKHTQADQREALENFLADKFPKVNADRFTAWCGDVYNAFVDAARLREHEDGGMDDDDDDDDDEDNLVPSPSKQAQGVIPPRAALLCFRTIRALSKSTHQSESDDDAVFGLTPLSFLNPDEARGAFAGFSGIPLDAVAAEDAEKPSSLRTSASASASARAALPPTFDMRTEKGVVPPIKDQGVCGSCWAFAATNALETAVNRALLSSSRGRGAVSYTHLTLPTIA